ncbi:MAG: TonB-dependent receptor [Pseudomonadales bacterium]|nr:TonB-dependent receptor [Pseudomonadales bacterium]
MKMKNTSIGRTAILLAGSLVFFQQPLTAAEMEEIVVEGRLRSSAEQLINERMEEEVVTDVLGAEMIGRVGDSTVAAALRRVSGLSLVNNKFVYVRGLGERYSSTTLNGATIPSPDLSRNVIPLDIFPTSIVESLSVQKSYSADKAASFGGGGIDIRTKGIPDDFTYSIELSGGLNSESTGDLLSYAGGSDDKWGTDDGTRKLSGEITQAIARFRGEIDPQSILTTLRQEGNSTATLADAVALNRQLGLGLNRNISIKDKSTNPDFGIKASIGNNFYIGDDIEFGVLAAGGYEAKWRETHTIARNFQFPDQRFEDETESTYSVDLNAIVTTGLQYTDDHKLTTTSLYLRNTDDETAIINFFNENRELADGIGFRESRIKYEERSMTVNQARGEHYIGAATRELLRGWVPAWIPEETRVDWMYTQARANTSIPNEVSVASETTVNATTGVIENAGVSIDSAAADYRFTDLEDEVTNYNWQVALPLEFSGQRIELSGGAEHGQKLRTYRQSQFSLGALSVANASVLDGPLGSVFSDTNITNGANEFVFDLAGTNNQSYIAATMTDAVFGKMDWTIDETWRISAGARWEDYRQIALDWNIYGYTVDNPQITTDPVKLQNASYQNDDIYPSVSLTYMGELWAEVFQLRFGWSETIVRPDLREITDASYIDARTGFLTDGNPGVLPADIRNFDIRAEWFFDSGDNFTVTLYRKEIDNPIEFFESAASDTNRAREIINAESGTIDGIEFEGMKSLGFLGEYGEAFFLQGNVTLQDTELVAGTQADAPTNQVRDLAGASDYVVNLVLGFDSFDGAHAATLVYNVFGDRLYVAGRNGAPDSYEQPFHALDLTYSWYPTDTITVKAKVQNLLDETIRLEQSGVEVFEETPGISYAVSFNWTF